MCRYRIIIMMVISIYMISLCIVVPHKHMYICDWKVDKLGKIAVGHGR